MLTIESAVGRLLAAAETGAPGTVESAATGGAAWPWVLAALGLVAAGAAVVMARKRRRGFPEWEVFSRKRDRLRLRVLRSLEDRVVIYDTDINIIGKYGRLEKTDYSTSDVRGVSLAEVLRKLPPDQVELHIGAVKEALKGEMRLYEWTWEGNGRVGRYQTKVCPVRDEGNRIIGAVSVSRDVTDLKK